MDISGFLERTGIKPTQLAKRLGLSKSMVSMLKSGRSEPSYGTCSALLRMGMTVEELFGREAGEAVARQVALSGLELSDEECGKILRSGLSSIGVKTRPKGR